MGQRTSHRNVDEQQAQGGVFESGRWGQGIELLGEQHGGNGQAIVVAGVKERRAAALFEVNEFGKLLHRGLHVGHVSGLTGRPNVHARSRLQASLRLAVTRERFAPAGGRFLLQRLVVLQLVDVGASFVPDFGGHVFVLHQLTLLILGLFGMASQGKARGARSLGLWRILAVLGFKVARQIFDGPASSH